MRHINGRTAGAFVKPEPSPKRFAGRLFLMPGPGGAQLNGDFPQWNGLAEAQTARLAPAR